MLFHTLFSFLILVSCCLLLTTTSIAFIPTTITTSSTSLYSLTTAEYNALFDLYRDTSGELWTWKQPYSLLGYPWNFTTSSKENNPCSSVRPWQGIMCTSNCEYKPCHLLTITLYDSNMNGTLPSSIGNACRTSLQELRIVGNPYLIGTIPASYGNLTNLVNLDLNTNHLTGSIPETLSTLPRLEGLYVNTNRLTGTLAMAITNMSSLQWLSLHENLFTGTLPSSSQSWGKNVSCLYLYQNQFTGTLPVVILTELPRLQNLSVGNNELTGTIPNIDVNNTLQFVEQFYLYKNQFTGTIPSSLGDMFRMLKLCYLNDNYLTGTIPSNFGNERLSETLINLYLYHNHLTGSIPSSLGDLHALFVLYLNDNYLSGTIPSSFGKMNTSTPPSLFDLDLSYNELTGTIPASLGNLTHLIAIDVNNNALTGTLPPTIGNLTRLLYLDVDSNQLTGTIPFDAYDNLMALRQLYLYNNRFTGSLSDSLSHMSSLEYIEVDNNFLTGTIPSTLGNPFASNSSTNSSNGLLYVKLYNNLLTGSLPSSLLNAPTLQGLQVNNNMLTGTIPLITDVSAAESSSSANNQLQLLILGSNMLTGTIPVSIGNFSQLIDLDLNTNFLTGTLSSSLLEDSMMVNTLNALLIYNNLLSGTLPSSMTSSMSNAMELKLISFDISNNMFSGTLSETLFSHTGNALQSVNVDHNEFTGHIPDSLFSSPKLTSVVLGSNCFTGTLSNAICSAQSLTQLILDGLHSSRVCTSRAFPFISNSGVVMPKGVYGTIPSCLFQLSNLSVLHLGGNAFSGSIASVPLSTSLTELVLSNNALTGTIPSYVWYSNVMTLDLSYNRLQGQLPSDLLPSIETNMSLNATVNLRVNQLSGKIPHSLKSLPVNHINILEGNMFSCDTDRNDLPENDLPENDPKYDSYNCGSDSTNNSLIVFGSVLFVLLVGVLLFRTLNTAMKSWLHGYSTGNFLQLDIVLLRLQQMDFYLVSVTVVIGLLLFGCLSIDYSSYENSYVWKVSAIYMSGVVPSCLLLVWFLGFVVAISWMKFQRLQSSNVSILMESVPTPTKMINKQWFSTTTVVLVNIIVVTIVNGLYVSAVYSNYTLNILTLIAFSLSIFKYTWNVLLQKGSKQFIDITDKMTIGLCLFNNLIAPFLAEMFVSSDCFLYLLSQPPSLLFTYQEYSCQSNQIVFQGFTYSQLVCGLSLSDPSSASSASSSSLSTGTLIVDPPFHYSHQCSFSLISSYSNVIIYRYIVSGLIVPVCVWCIRATSCWNPSKTAAQLLPGMWRLSSLVTIDTGNEERFENDLNRLERYIKKGSLRQHFVANFVTDVSILICFGAVFPPVAIVVGIAIWKDIIDIKLALGRLQLIMEGITLDTTISMRMKDTLLQLRDNMIKEYRAGEREIVDGIWYGLCISCIIWSLILFDTLSLSVSVGSYNSLWIVILVMLSPFLVYFVLLFLKRYSVLLWIERKDICIDSSSNCDRIETMNPITATSSNKCVEAVELEMKTVHDNSFE